MFVQYDFDYCGIIYEKAYNSSFHQKIESVQYNGCLAITGAMRGTSKEKLYDELGPFNSLAGSESCANFTNMNLLGITLVPLRKSPYCTRNTESIPLFKKKQQLFLTILDHNIRNNGSFSAFKNNILKFFRPTPNNVFNCENHRGIKLVTKLRVDPSHLHEQKFKHSFQDTLSPIYSCGFDVELTFHCILRCPMYNNERHTLLSTTKNIDCRLLDVTETILIKTFLFGNCFVDADTNTH